MTALHDAPVAARAAAPAPGVLARGSVAPARHQHDERVLTIRSDAWELDVLPATGAGLAAGRIRTSDGVWRDLLRPTPRSVLGDPSKIASFVMVPWSNRLRGGVLEHGGRRWQLQHDAADGTAMHGAARCTTWTVADRSAHAVTLEVDTSGLVGVNFPWRFAARVRYALDGPRLTVTTTVRNVDDEPFPAGFGHHPYLQRTLRAVAGPLPCPPGRPVLDVPLRRGYALSAGIASAAAGQVPARADFRDGRELGTAFVDDVLTDWPAGRAVRITYPGGGGAAGADSAGVAPPTTVELAADAAYGHLVLYAPRGRGCFAVEPVTHVNGGFALHEAGVPGTGVFVLQPGEQRSGTFTLTVR